MPGRDGVRALAPTFTVMGKHIFRVLTSTNPEMPKMGDLGCSWYCRWVNGSWCLRLLLCLWISQPIETNKNQYTFTVIYTIWNVNSNNWFRKTDSSFENLCSLHWLQYWKGYDLFYVGHPLDLEKEYAMNKTFWKISLYKINYLSILKVCLVRAVWGHCPG